MRPITKEVRRLSKLRLIESEKLVGAERLQRDMLRQLERFLFGADRLAGLAHCARNHCGRVKCSEVCQFGTRRRRLADAAAVRRLFEEGSGPVCEVLVGRGTWMQSTGNLNPSIDAAQKLNRWSLDKLYMPNLVAVGSYKVAVASEYADQGWKCVIHQIIQGADKSELEGAFSKNRPHPDNFLFVTEVEDIRQTINDVLRCEVMVWQNPYLPGTTPVRPKKARRAEYYEWLLGLKPGERVVRYGCDRYFNRLQKKPRLFKEKIIKKRQLSRQLVRSMFGTHPQTCRCIRCDGPNR